MDKLVNNACCYEARMETFCPANKFVRPFISVTFPGSWYPFFTDPPFYIPPFLQPPLPTFIPPLPGCLPASQPTKFYPPFGIPPHSHNTLHQRPSHLLKLNMRLAVVVVEIHVLLGRVLALDGEVPALRA
jgi:hypothetical protein